MAAHLFSFGIITAVKMLADSSHLVAQSMLALEIKNRRSCDGISGKSLILFLTTFIARYSSLILLPWQGPFSHSLTSFYYTAMKIAFISIHSILVYFVYRKYKSTKVSENFRIEFLIIASAAISFLVSPSSSFFVLLETFSLVLEAVAMIPQLYLLYRLKINQASAITSHYIFVSGAYRVLYVIYWFLLYFLTGELRKMKIICGTIQTLTYLYFFYLYFKQILENRRIQLPQ